MAEVFVIRVMLDVGDALSAHAVEDSLDYGRLARRRPASNTDDQRRGTHKAHRTLQAEANSPQSLMRRPIALSVLELVVLILVQFRSTLE